MALKTPTPLLFSDANTRVWRNGRRAWFWAAPQAASIKAADPDAEVFVSTSARELTMYKELAPEPWKNEKLAAASAS
ncbi:MAG: hypothetical protein WBI91_02205 [Coriobacteriia bacterium]